MEQLRWGIEQVKRGEELGDGGAAARMMWEAMLPLLLLREKLERGARSRPAPEEDGEVRFGRRLRMGVRMG